MSAQNTPPSATVRVVGLSPLRLTLSALAVFCAVSLSLSPSSEAAQQTAFSTAQNSQPTAEFDQKTVRVIAPTQLGGRGVRLRLSNRYGAAAVRVRGSVSPLGSSSPPLRFRARLGAGESAVTKRLPLRARPGSELSVSLFFSSAPSVSSDSIYLQSPVSVLSGRQLDPRRPPAQPASPIQRLPLLERVSVIRRRLSPRPVIVCVGASGTDGAGAGIGESYPDQLRALYAAERPLERAPIVFNAGISGNRLSSDAPSSRSLLHRLRADVFSLRPSAVVALIGSNDLISGGAAPSVISGLRQLQSWFRGVGAPRLFLSTLTPFGGMIYYPEGEVREMLTQRAGVNEWIRSQQSESPVIDLDKLLRDPIAPDRLQDRYAFYDLLHPNAAGYAAEAHAVELALRSSGF